MSWLVGSLLKEFASLPLWDCWSSPCPKKRKNNTVSARNGPASAFGHSMVIMPTSPRFCMVTTLLPLQSHKKVAALAQRKKKKVLLTWALHVPIKTPPSLMRGAINTQSQASRRHHNTHHKHDNTTKVPACQRLLWWQRGLKPWRSSYCWSGSKPEPDRQRWKWWPEPENPATKDLLGLKKLALLNRTIVLWKRSRFFF